ncbi:hypothetical protein AOQ88_01170 [Candidatus Riesia sp. GBBU]|nr:hypothetical protein AOQ88_01170 [Candidatus Riesia sp. GBBU]
MKKYKKFFFTFVGFIFLVLFAIDFKRCFSYSRCVMYNFFNLIKKDITDEEKTQRIYVILRNINETKKLVESQDFREAEKKLKESLSILFFPECNEIEDLICIRLARIQISMRKFSDSIKTIERVKNQDLEIVKKIKGDILMNTRNIKDSIHEYLSGIEISKNELFKMILKTKINNLL